MRHRRSRPGRARRGPATGFAAAAMLLAFAAPGPARAIVFTIDPAASSFQVAAIFGGDMFQDQSLCGFLTTIGGSIDVDLTPNSITFLGGSFVVVDQPGPCQPGDAPANVAGQLVSGPLSLFGAMRNVTGTVSSGPIPLCDETDPDFEGCLLGIPFTTAAVGLGPSLPQVGLYFTQAIALEILEGSVIDGLATSGGIPVFEQIFEIDGVFSTQPANLGILTVVGNDLTLQLPLEASDTFIDLNTGLELEVFTFTQVVARAVIPEPSAPLLLASGLSALALRRRRRRLQNRPRALRLAAVRAVAICPQGPLNTLPIRGRDR